LRKELVLCIERGEESIQQSTNELRRLKREHLNSQKELDNCQKRLIDTNNQLNKVLERQSLNDKGLATLFKINRISAALEL